MGEKYIEQLDSFVEIREKLGLTPLLQIEVVRYHVDLFVLLVKAGFSLVISLFVSLPHAFIALGFKIGVKWEGWIFVVEELLPKE